MRFRRRSDPSAVRMAALLAVLTLTACAPPSSPAPVTAGPVDNGIADQAPHQILAAATGRLRAAAGVRVVGKLGTATGDLRVDLRVSHGGAEGTLWLDCGKLQFRSVGDS